MYKNVALSIAGLAISATAVAAAEVTITPSATFGVKSTDAGSTWNADANVVAKIETQVETSDGLVLGGALVVESGNLADSDGVGAAGHIIDPYLFVRGDWGEVYAKENDDDEALFGYTNTFRDTSVTLEYNWDTEVTKAAVSQSFGDFSLSGEVNTADEWNVKAAFDNGSVNGSVKVDQADVVTVTAGAANNGFTVGAEYGTNDEWKVSAGYSVGMTSISASYEHDDDYTFESSFGINENLAVYLNTKVEDQLPQEIGVGIKLSF